MHELYKQLRSNYITALRSVVPEIVRWWFENSPYHWKEEVPDGRKLDFLRRWPVGPAAHPRIIAIFRQYYFMVWELNDRLSQEEKEMSVKPETISFQRPTDLLVSDLSTVAPDLFDIMDGLLYVPIGMDLNGQEC